MDTIHMEFHGICMQSHSMLITRRSMDILLKSSKQDNVNLYNLLNSTLKFNSLLPEDDLLTYWDNCYMYCNQNPDAYIAINNQDVKKLNFKDIKHKQKNINFEYKHPEYCIIEKCIINYGIMYFKNQIGECDKSDLNKIYLPIFKSTIDKSFLFNTVFYNNFKLDLDHQELFANPINIINIRFDGKNACFINIFDKIINKTCNTVNNVITDIAKTIQ